MVLVGNTFGIQVLGNWGGDAISPFLLNEINLLYINMKRKARLPGSPAGEDKGRCKVRDPLRDVCLCQPLLQAPGESQRPHQGFWGFCFHVRQIPFICD